MAETARIRFDHVSIAVKSIDRALEWFARYFPITVRHAKQFEEQLSGPFYWIDFWLGGFVIELIEDPPGRPGFVTKFIEKKGEGMHHLSLEVERLGPLVERLEADGVRVVEKQGDGSSPFAFISPRSAFGALIQLWQVADFDAPHRLPPPSESGVIFDHFSFAVKDILAGYRFFRTYFPPVDTWHEPHLAGSTGTFVLGHMTVGGRKVEFVQSPGAGTRGDFVGKFIERYGEGLHHMTLIVKDFDSTLARLKAGGVRIVDESQNWRGEKEFYISPRSAFGVLIQCWDRDEEE
ncbi:MAG TPA: VOC family protein [Candidatus Binataceae bacterium]|nr:VOC family protein [Candidatus Binataceae bacterium]